MQRRCLGTPGKDTRTWKLMRVDIEDMNHNYFTKWQVFLIICGLVGLCGLAGCARPNYKEEADEQVYKIIDQKWREEFGTKANFKLNDATPSPNDIQIEKTIPDNGVLTLPRAVAVATAHNSDYQTEKEALYIMALDLRLVQHNYERLYYGRPKGIYGKIEGVDYVGVGAGVEPRFNTDRVGQDLPVRVTDDRKHLDGDEFSITDGFGFDQLLSDGTVIGMNVARSWGRIMNGFLEGESLIPLFSVELVKPLLRGSDRRVVLENLTQAERDTLYQVRSFNRYRKTFVVSIISQYYQVLYLADMVKNARRSYNILDWLYQRTEPLVDAGRVPKLELDRIHQERLRALDSYVQAEREYRQLLDEFKIALNLPPTAEFQLDESELAALRAAKMTYPDFSEAEVVEAALAQRLDLANSADTIMDAQRKVYVAADGLGAQLDLSVNTNILLKDFSSSNTDVFQNMFLSGLQMDLPFDRTFEQNIYRKSLIALSQRLREYEDASDMVALEVRQAYRDLNKGARRYKVQMESLQSAQKRFKDTFLLLQYGRASSRRVLNAQRDLFDSQNAATEALVNYVVATLDFYRDTGVLKVRPDGMWEL